MRTAVRTASLRLIPACAGKTSLRDKRARDVQGSSPRVRGKRRPGCRLWRRRGLIPACAGKTWAIGVVPDFAGAHPRVCGENYSHDLRTCEQRGSSPRVRGKPGPGAKPPQADGLIPACAGKTTTRTQRPYLARAHPRVCGENATTATLAGFDAGSSPRVRGKLFCELALDARSRLIPACAGKTASIIGAPRPCRAHPRVCGENAVRRAKRPGVKGSSPRVRGKRRKPLRRRVHHRLIPACAGKTRALPVVQGQGEAHPRVCGENTIRSLGASGVCGSSPRVRGKLSALPAKPSQRGLIPACAGKTEDQQERSG